MNAINNLVIAFPPAHGYNGACTTILDVSRHGLTAHALGLTPDKRAAVSLIVSASMERSQSHGQGNKAKKRLYLERIARAEASFFARNGFHMMPPKQIRDLIATTSLAKPTEQRADIYDSRSHDDAGEVLCTA